jgi:hypothetical protein
VKFIIYSDTQGVPKKIIIKETEKIHESLINHQCTHWKQLSKRQKEMTRNSTWRKPEHIFISNA